MKICRFYVNYLESLEARAPYKVHSFIEDEANIMALFDRGCHLLLHSQGSKLAKRILIRMDTAIMITTKQSIQSLWLNISKHILDVCNWEQTTYISEALESVKDLAGKRLMDFNESLGDIMFQNKCHFKTEVMFDSC